MRSRAIAQVGVSVGLSDNEGPGAPKGATYFVSPRPTPPATAASSEAHRLSALHNQADAICASPIAFDGDF